MADEQDQQQQQEEKKGGKGKLIIAAVLVLVVAGGAYMFLFSGGGEEEPVATEPVEGLVVDGATMTVALSGDEPSFARVGFALVLAEGVDTVEVGQKIQIMQDSALTVITGYQAGDLKSVEGLDRLRGDLTTSAHDIWDPNEVLRVVLTEVIVQ